MPVTAATLLQLREAIEASLGRGNRPEVERLRVVDAQSRPDGVRLFVDWAINRGSTIWLTRTGAQIDVLRIVRAVQQTGMVGETLAVQGSYPVMDTAGQPQETIVLVARFSRQTVEDTNWERVSYDGVAPKADVFWLHGELMP